MIRKSIKTRRELLEAIADSIPAFQDAADAVDEAAGRVLGLNRTDLRCLGILLRGGPTSAGNLARATGLTRGAMTTVLDRLEQAGYARRVPDPDDRRGVEVEVTERVLQPVEVIWGPIRDEGARQLASFSVPELGVLLRFLERGRALQESHAARIRSMLSVSPASRTRPTSRRARPRPRIGKRPRYRTARRRRDGG